MRKNFLSKILISAVMIGIFLLPISPSLNSEKNNLVINTKINRVSADEVLVGLKFDVSINTAEIEKDSTSKVTFNIHVASADKTTDFEGTTIEGYRKMYVALYPLQTGEIEPKPNAVSLRNGISDEMPNDPSNGVVTEYTMTPVYSPLLAQGTRYYYLIVASDGSFNPASQSFKENIDFIAQDKLSHSKGEFTVGSTANPSVITNSSESSQVKDPALNFGCGVTSGKKVVACIAYVTFLFWQVSAWIAHLAGSFLDFFVYYSTDSESYKSGFVEKGWGAIRDIANMFFIIALLYVAIKTILGLNVSDNKKIIGYVIIIALLLNFSLFFTQVIIDSTNILAKVFYNNITSKDSNGAVLPGGAGGQKSISIGLVDKFNPQSIFSQDLYKEMGPAKFIFVTLLLIAITLYTAYMFFSIALLFVARVVSLWIYMIFSPIAFASYTLPFEIPGFGHKEWWSEVLKNAFLAPIFIFLLYIIVMFAGFLDEVAKYSSNADLMQKLMTVVIPFIILFVLLMKAKELAVKYSGEMGKAIIKGGEMIGGIALGAAAGGAAIVGRAALGKAGSAMNNSTWANKMANSDSWMTRKIGLAAKDVGKAAGKGSFDVRGIKIAGKDLGSTGLKVNAIGKPNQGGFEKIREDRINKRKRRAEELEVGEYEPQKLALKKNETILKKAENKTHSEFEDIDKRLEINRQKMNDANKSGDQPEAKRLGKIVKDLEQRKLDIKQGKVVDELDKDGNKIKIGEVEEEVEVEEMVDDEVDEMIDEMIDEEKTVGTGIMDMYGKEIMKQEKTGNKIPNPNGNQVPSGIKKKTGTQSLVKSKKKVIRDIYKQQEHAILDFNMTDLEKQVKQQKRDIVHENQHRRELLARDFESGLNKAWNQVISLGQYSNLGADEAAYGVRMEMKGKPKEPKAHGPSHAPTEHKADTHAVADHKADDHGASHKADDHGASHKADDHAPVHH